MVIITKIIFLGYRQGPKLKFTVWETKMPINPFKKREEQRKKRAQRREAQQPSTVPAAKATAEPGATDSPPMSDLEKTWAGSLKTEQVEALVSGILNDVLAGAIRSVVKEVAVKKEASQEVPIVRPETVIRPETVTRPETEEMEVEEDEAGGYLDS